MKITIPKENFQSVTNFIGGRWSESNNNAHDVYSPYSGTKIAEVFYSNAADVDQAAKSAKAAQKEWAATPLKNRTQVMYKFRELLIERADEISHVVALENGKTHGEAKAGLYKGIEVLEYAISLQNLDEGSKMEVSRGVHCEYRREPLGVVGSITPFNFPAMVPLWTIPIALTLGNAYIWKPSEKTPLTSLYIANALKDAGIPDGVFSVIQGDRTAVEAIIDHPEIKSIGFVGSTKIAKLVYARATSLGKRCLALGGAKNHIILLPDASPELSGVGISDSFTGCAGQRCMAASVLLAVGDCNHIIEEIKKRSQSQILGDSMGAIITKEQVEFLNNSIQKAIDEGATLLLDGRQTAIENNDYKGGYWIGPTILDNVKPGSHAATTELFGPVLSIIRCQNITQALEIENSNTYGNAASVFTSNGALAEKVVKSASAGMVGVNIGVPVPREPFSFGGINQSKFGQGDITGDESLNLWSNLKKVTTKWEMQSDHNWMS